MSVQMIAVDMDGTLIHTGGYISSRNAAALRAARAKGIAVVIATGRRHHYAMKVLDTLDLGPEEVVLSSNGTVARTAGGRLLFRSTLDRETAAWLFERLGDLRNAFVLTFDTVDERGQELPGALVLEDLEHLHGSIAKWMHSNAASMRHVEQLETVLEEDGAPIQAMLCGTMKRMHAAHALLGGEASTRIQMHRTEYPARDLCILDILPPNCSKGTALLQLAAERGINAEDIMCIGDNWNDLAMLEVAGHPVVMGNAPQPLLALARERGWGVTASHDEDGVAEVIEAALSNPGMTP